MDGLLKERFKMKAQVSPKLVEDYAQGVKRLVEKLKKLI